MELSGGGVGWIRGGVLSGVGWGLRFSYGWEYMLFWGRRDNKGITGCR